ncbi:MAG: methyltransferase domain-containing protein [Spirochaetaceae bacterium]
MKTFSKSPAGRERHSLVPCVVCGSRDYRPYRHFPDHVYVRCRRCGHVFQQPMPVSEDLSLRYDDEYFRYELENAEIFFELMRLGLEDIDFSFDPSKAPTSRVLDIGCATGRLLEEFKRAGWEPAGVEVCEPAAEYARQNRGVEVFVGTLEESRFPEGHFGVVHSSHVIEHIADARAFVQEIYRVLAPGGRLVIVTPDRGGFQARLFGSRWRSVIPDHVHLFTAKGLKRLLEDVGFDVLRKVSWGGLARGAAPEWIKRPVDRLAKKANVGDVMLLSAVRPPKTPNAGY